MDKKTILKWGLVIGAVIYIASPLDVIPDMPVIGSFDDVGVALAAMKKFNDILDEQKKERQQARETPRVQREDDHWVRQEPFRGNGQVIDAEYRRG